MKIGVIAIQGAVSEHVDALRRALAERGVEAEVVEINHKGIVPKCSGIVIPGGESTTLCRLLAREGIAEEIKDAAARGVPILGTCAGLILLAKEIVDSDQWRLGYLDATVERNAYGRQVDSFEADIEVTGVRGGPVRAVFIRAPVIRAVRGDCESIAEFDGLPVVVRQGHLLGASFHPEQTDDTRIHAYFISMCS